MSSQPHKSKTIDRYLKPNSFIFWDERIYQLEQPAGVKIDPLLVWVRDIETTELISIRMEALLLAEGKGQAQAPLFAPTLKQLQQEMAVRYIPAAPVPATDLPDTLLQKATRMVTVIETIQRLVAEKERLALAQGQKMNYTAVLKQACAGLEEPLGLTSYYKYRRLYQRYDGDMVRMAAAFRRKSFNQTRMSRAQLHFVDTLILRFYAGQRTVRPKPQALYHIFQAALARTQGFWLDPDKCPGTGVENVVEELLDHRLPIQVILDNPEKAAWLTKIQMPSTSWFYGYLRWFEAQPDQGQAIVVKRHGRETWEREFMVFDTFVQRAIRPLEYVFADHWLLDLFIVDEATRRQLDRLWLTVLLDAYSRSVLGMALLYETPCIESIQLALQHAVWPKTSHQAVGLEQEWVCYGIPQQLSLDNAWAHHAYSLEQLARAISQGGKYNSIDLLFRPPYRGRYGALIERLFGNFSGQFQDLLPGAISSSQPKIVSHAASRACLLYQDIYKLMHQLILRYQHTPHRELAGLTPHQKWLEGWALGYGGWPPPLTEAIDRLFWRRSPQARVINRKGISVFGLHYWSPEVELLPRKDRQGQPVRYGFSYKPADISQLALFRDQQWVGDLSAKELRRADGSLQSISLWERRMAQELARDRGQAGQDWLAWVNELDELAQQRTREKRQAQRNVRPHSSAAVTKQAGEPDYTELLLGFVREPAAGGEA